MPGTLLFLHVSRAEVRNLGCPSPTNGLGLVASWSMTESAFVLAPRSQAAAILEAGGPMVPGAPWPKIVLGSMTTIEVASLVGCVLDLDADALEALESKPEILANADKKDGPWVYALPAAFTTAVRTLPPAGIARIASVWAKTEELAEYDRAELQDIVQQAVTMVRSATGDAVLLHWCDL
jgi:hypothetical protein